MREEHSFLKNDSCMYWQHASLNPVAALDDDKRHGRVAQADPFPPDLLYRLQLAALGSRRVPPAMKDAIRATLQASGREAY